MDEVSHILLRPCEWQSKQDFYDELLPQIGAPDWHGRNLDAVADSLVTGQINTVEPPFVIEVQRLDESAKFARALVQVLAEIAEEASESGRRIGMRFT